MLRWDCGDHRCNMTRIIKLVPAFGQVPAILHLSKGGMLKSMQNLTWYAFTGITISQVTADTQTTIIHCMHELGTFVPSFHFPEAFHNPRSIPRGAAIFQWCSEHECNREWTCQRLYIILMNCVFHRNKDKQKYIFGGLRSWALVDAIVVLCVSYKT